MALILLFLNDDPKHLAFLRTPVAIRKVCFSNAKPFEHASYPSDARNQARNLLPITHRKLFLNVLYLMLITVLGYYPN